MTSQKHLGIAEFFSTQVSSRSARIALPFALLAAGGATLLTKKLCASDENNVKGKWDIGLARTPPYVARWKRPSSIAAGKAQGLIPKDAIAYETGNDGKHFSSLTEWLDACNEANLPGAIETDVSVIDLPRSYIFRGLYGAGNKDVKIRWEGRSAKSRTSWLHAYLEDVEIRGIDFDGFDCVLGVTFPTLPLKRENGEIDPEPYHTSTEPVYETLKSAPGGEAEGFSCRRIGRIVTEGTFEISAVRVKRQMGRNSVRAGSKNNFYMDDVAWEATLETIELFSNVRCTSNREIAKAINKSAKGYGALLNLKGDVILTPAEDQTLAVLELSVEGIGNIETDVRSPAVDISHCTFTDTNVGLAAILDVTELGRITFCRNAMPGTWSGVAAFVSRWSEVYFSNNYWHDCWGKRPAAKGRSSSCLPAGSSMTALNTACYVGINNPVMMRYHRRGNTALIENNLVENVESLSGKENVNSAVFADIRNGWQSTIDDKIIRFAFNDIQNLRGLAGGGDCNVFYGKLRGFSVVGNRLTHFGAKSIAKDGQTGSEAAAGLFKNPGPYFSRIDGRLPEASVISGNIFIGGPIGQPWIKVDESINSVVIDNNLFRNWSNIRDNNIVESGPTAGLVRITSHQFAPRITRNRFENIGNITGDLFFLISVWNISSAEGSFDLATFEFSNNVVVVPHDSPLFAQKADLAPIIIQIRSGMPQDPEAAAARIMTGGNNIVSSRGDKERPTLIRMYDLGKSFSGNQSAQEDRYEPDRYLFRYGST